MSKSKLAAKLNSKKTVSEEGKQIRELDTVQDALRQQIVAFAKEIKSVSVPASRTQADNDRYHEIMFKMAEYALQLNRLSMSEGAQVTATAALNLIYRLNDKINELLLQNANLNERLKKLEEKHEPK